MAEPDGTVTTVLLSAVTYLKDNRLLPDGFDKTTADDDVAVRGSAESDADFAGGRDRVRYVVDVSGAKDRLSSRSSCGTSPSATAGPTTSATRKPTRSSALSVITKRWRTHRRSPSRAPRQSRTSDARTMYTVEVSESDIQKEDVMNRGRTLLVVGVALLIAGIATPVVVGQEVIQGVEIPQPTVPEIFTLTGEFVRVAYNNEGYVTLGYRVANDSVAEDWMLLEIGATLRGKTKGQTMKRDALSLMLPDGSTVGLATQKEFANAGHLPALNMRANVVRDSINYFPVQANQPCVIGFFSDPTGARSISFDQVELSSNRACLGRLFFHVPGKIQTGQH